MNELDEIKMAYAGLDYDSHKEFCENLSDDMLLIDHETFSYQMQRACPDDESFWQGYLNNVRDVMKKRGLK